MPNPAQTDRMISAKGEPVVLQRKRAGAVPATWPLTVFLTGYKADAIDGTVVQVGDRKAIVSAMAIARAAITGGTPLAQDDLIRNGAQGKVLSVQLVEEAGRPDRYILQIRGLPG